VNSAATYQNLVPTALHTTLNDVAGRMSDRKDEIVDLLSGEQPAKSRQVDLSYVRCTWLEGCYYCQDEQGQWYRIKCFI
jgi:hypothetical protein